MTTTPGCTEESEVRLTVFDLWITRLAIQERISGATREEHIGHDIRAALANLSDGREPGNSECDCVPEKTNV